MALIEFKNLPDTSTPLSAENLNHNFNEVKVESGSNGNGSYVKYADGTMICNKYISGYADVTTSWDSLYEGSIRCGDYPQPFIEKPFAHATPCDGNGVLIQCFGSNQNESSFGTLYVVLPGSFTNRKYTINLLAIGKWK